MVKEKKKLTPVYLAGEEKKVLAAAAKREGRSLSAYLALAGLKRAEVMHGLVCNRENEDA